MHEFAADPRPLTKNWDFLCAKFIAIRAGPADNVLNGEEVGGEFQLPDDFQFALKVFLHLGRHAVRKNAERRLPR